MQQQCAKLGIPIERQPAVDGKNGPKLHSKCTALESATTAGHLAMWKRCLESGKPMAIFEDDVFFCRKFRQRWNTEIELPADIDMMPLGLGYAELNEAGVPHLWKAGKGYGLFAYIIFPAGAAKLIAAFEADPHYICDLYTSNMMEAGKFNVYLPKPFWCVAQWAESDTHDREHVADPHDAYGEGFEDALEIALDAPVWMKPKKR